MRATPEFRNEGEAQPLLRPEAKPLLRGIASAARSAPAGRLAGALGAADARSRRFVCAPTRRPLAPTLVLDLVRHWFLLFAARRLAHCHRGKRIASRRITPGPETCRPCSAHHSLSGSSCPVQTESCKRRSSESVRWERGPRGGRQPGAGNRPSGVVERWRRGREQRGQWMERCGGSCSARLGWRLEIGSGTQTQLSAADYTCRIHLKYGRRPTRGSAVAAGRLLPLGARKLRAVSYSANSRSLGTRMRCCWYPTARRA